MMETLKPLHEKIDKGHTTLKEQSFNQVKLLGMKLIFHNLDLLQGT